MRGAFPLVASFVLAAVGLAGCAQEPSADPAPVDPVTGEPLQEFRAPGDLPAWHYGQSWTHNWTLRFSPGETLQFDAQVVVTNVTAAGYELAADSLQTALWHSTFFFPDLGFMSHTLSEVTQGDFRFPWYDFPLHDGKTWTAPEANLDFSLQPVQNDLTLTVTTMANGTADVHYMVTARDADGLRAYYDYRPTVGWFTHFRAYDGGEDLENWTIEIVTTASEPAWSGTWYRAFADLELAYMSVVVPTQAVLPQPPASFDVGADATHVQVILFSFAVDDVPGAFLVQLLAPDGTRYQSVAAPATLAPTLAGVLPSSDILQVSAQAGTWHVASGGASPFAAGGALIAWSATVTQGYV